MPVWLAIGGVVVGAIVGGSHDSHDDYDDYDNYSNHSDYSDYAERQRRRKNAAYTDYQCAKDGLNPGELRGYLSGTVFDRTTVDWENVNENNINSVAIEKIRKSEQAEIEAQTADLTKDINDINDAIEQLRTREEMLKKLINVGGDK